MESILSLFALHDTLFVSLLVLGIMVVVILLLLFGQKSPESVVQKELGGSENVEGALRRVLGEQRWLQAGVPDSPDGQKLQQLETEVLEKDRAIAELNKQLTHSGGGDGEGGGVDPDIANRIAELEARLQEYEIIEDDIADLSLYKTENEKLKAELARLKGEAGIEESPAEPVAMEEPVETATENEPKIEIAAAEEVAPIKTDDSEHKVDGADLVAEFEKVVNSQSQLETGDEPDVSMSKKDDVDTGKVVMTGEGSKIDSESDLAVHPKLKNISPDSKEEADVFITELKSLRAAQKKASE